MPVSKFKEGDEQYDVWLRAEAAADRSAQADRRPDVPSPTAGLVQLGSLAEAEREPRADRDRAAQPPADRRPSLGNPDGHLDLGEAVDAMVREVSRR